MINNNQILIKDRSGRIRPVNLDMQVKVAPLVKTAPVFAVATAEKAVATTEKKEIETKEPKSNLIAKEMAMPSFYFNLEDEQEAAQFKSQEQIKAKEKKQVVIEYAIDDILKKSLTIDEGGIDRLRKIIESRLRDIRDLIETKDALIKTKIMGGAGLSEEQAKLILKNIEQYRIKIYEGNDLEQEIISAVSFRPEITNSYHLPRFSESAGRQVFDIIKKESSAANNAQVLNKAESISDIKRPTSQDIVRPLLKVWPSLSAVKPINKEPGVLFQPNKIIYAPLARNRPIYGPIEELAHLSVEDLRHLGKNLPDALIKIKHKIDMLQDESYEKRTLGLKAWRQSPVYQNYLAIGRQSVENGHDIQQIIKEKQIRNEQCLTYDEFTAVADFNEELSY